MFFIGLISGIISSLAAAVIFLASTDGIRGLRLTRRFSKLRGRYAQCDLAGQSLANQFTDITHVRHNLLTIEGDDPVQGKWHSTILMDERFPGFGFGQYQYDNQHDCGRHEIQVAHDGRTIFVQAQNTSHGRNNTFAYLWKRA
jgi:hypothetical protein